MNNINLVTGFWSIRKDRTEENYLFNFKNVLSISNNMTIFIPKKYEEMVLKVRSNMLEKTDIKIIELEDIRDKYFSEYWDYLQKIRTDSNWVNSTDWLWRVPQTFSEWYNPIVMSKVFFINEAYQKNTFDSQTYIWIDAGITQHIPKEFVSSKSVKNMAKYIDKVFFTSFEYKNAKEMHGFDYNGFLKYLNGVPQWVCRATIFGADKDYVKKFNEDYKYYLKDTLQRGYLGTEECIFTILSAIDSDIYNMYYMGTESMPVSFLKQMENEGL